jgi:hypothetical protein
VDDGWHDLADRRRAIERERAAGAGAAVVSEDVWASWDRCRRVLRSEHPNVPVDDGDVSARWEVSPIRRAAPHALSILADSARDAGMIAIVTDPAGQVLWATGGTPELRRHAGEIGLVPGGRWDEPVAGTNGIALALVTGRTAAVFADEHWSAPVRDWVCYSAPVRTPAGDLVGVLDLSTSWDRANPLAAGTIGALARMTELELAAATPSWPGLELHVLGRGRATLHGRPLSLGPRQIELLFVLAVVGSATLDELHALLYGDRPISMTTLRAEISHTRAALGGAIASRPYRLTVPVRVDALDVLESVARGDVAAAAMAYAGQLLPTSEAPLVIERRYHLDVAVRTALLARGSTRDLLRYADIHPYDVEVLERAVAMAAPEDPDRPAAVAALAVANAEL